MMFNLRFSEKYLEQLIKSLEYYKSQLQMNSDDEFVETIDKEDELRRVNSILDSLYSMKDDLYGPVGEKELTLLHELLNEVNN